MQLPKRVLKGREDTSSFHLSVVWNSDTTAGTPAATKHCEDKGHTLGMAEQSAGRSQILQGHGATIPALDCTLRDDFCIKEK